MNSYYPESGNDEKIHRIKAIAGLGNPGDKYISTRHNLGFGVVDLLKGQNEFQKSNRKFKICGTKIASFDIDLLKPLTYMNLSGRAIHKYASSNNILPEEILVICDDYNLQLGRLRLRQSGSDGGHNGLASVIEELGTRNFPRLRLGIGPIPEDLPSEDYVLDRFTSDEEPEVREMLNRAKLAVESWIKNGFNSAAALFNKVNSED
jgi:PTH1 family peptidyl-tRNA hydrolase